VAARRVAQYYGAVRIAAESGGVLARKLHSLSHVFQGSGAFLLHQPTAAGLADAAILHAGCRQTGAGKSRAEMPRMQQIESGAPESTVDHNGERRNTRRGRESKIDELAGGLAVREAAVGGRCGLGHDSRLRHGRISYDEAMKLPG
jgi:hypothetical protein